MYLKSKTSENLRSGRTKRGAALLLAGMFALSAAGCSSSQSSSQKSSQESSQKSPETKTDTQDSEAPQTASSEAAKETDRQTELIVFAAASLTETLEEIAGNYREIAPDVSLTFNLYQEGSNILEQAVISLGQSDIKEYAKTLTQLFGEPTETYEKSYFFASGSKTLVLADPYGDGAYIEISLGE